MRDLLLLYLKRPQIAAALGLILGLFWACSGDG